MRCEEDIEVEWVTDVLGDDDDVDNLPLDSIDVLWELVSSVDPKNINIPSNEFVLGSIKSVNYKFCFFILKLTYTQDDYK